MTEPGNDRTRERPNPGTTEPGNIESGKFGFGACLDIMENNHEHILEDHKGSSQYIMYLGILELTYSIVQRYLGRINW